MKNDTLHTSLQELAILLDSFDEALCYYVKEEYEDVQNIIYHAALRRFDLLGRAFFDYIAVRLDIDRISEDWIEQIIDSMGSKSPKKIVAGVYLKEGLDALADMVSELQNYEPDPENRFPKEEFIDLLFFARPFIREILSEEYELLARRSENPFEIHLKEASL